VHLILSGYIPIWHFYRTLTRGLLFSTDTVYNMPICNAHTVKNISIESEARAVARWSDGYTVVEISSQRFLEGIYRRRVSFMGR